jgi:hypothetical protein
VSPEEIEELRKEFLKQHWAWEAVNNPAGYASGQVQEHWNKRIEALLKLVAAKRS